MVESLSQWPRLKLLRITFKSCFPLYIYELNLVNCFLKVSWVTCFTPKFRFPITDIWTKSMVPKLAFLYFLCLLGNKTKTTLYTWNFPSTNPPQIYTFTHLQWFVIRPWSDVIPKSDFYKPCQLHFLSFPSKSPLTQTAYQFFLKYVKHIPASSFVPVASWAYNAFLLYLCFVWGRGDFPFPQEPVHAS